LGAGLCIGADEKSAVGFGRAVPSESGFAAASGPVPVVLASDSGSVVLTFVRAELRPAHAATRHAKSKEAKKAERVMVPTLPRTGIHGPPDARFVRDLSPAPAREILCTGASP
jgi:hypothetical protein